MSAAAEGEPAGGPGAAAGEAAAASVDEPRRVLPAVAGVGGLFLTSSDVTGLTGLAGQLMGGWVAAHSFLGYDALDVAAWGRNALDEARGHAR